MPGYGYARAPKSAVKGWTRLIRDYLKGRRELKRVFVLIDARHGIKPNDKETMTLLDEAAVSYQVVLTKADKPKATELTARKEKIANDLAKHPASYPRIVTTSARMGSGIDVLRAAVAIAIDPSSSVLAHPVAHDHEYRDEKWDAEPPPRLAPARIAREQAEWAERCMGEVRPLRFAAC